MEEDDAVKAVAEVLPCNARCRRESVGAEPRNGSSSVKGNFGFEILVSQVRREYLED